MRHWFMLLGLLCFSASFGVAPSFSQTVSLDLDQLLEIAMGNNPQIVIARSQAEADEAVVTQSRSLYLPRITAGADYGRGYVDGGQPTDEDNVGSLLLGVSQLVYDFGKTTGLIDSSVLNSEAATVNLRQIYHDVVLEVKSRYYTVLEKRELIGVSEQAVDNYEQQLYRAERYYEAGVRTRIDVTNAQVVLSNQKLNLLRARSDLKSARVALEEVLGTRPNNGDYQLAVDSVPLEVLAESRPPMVLSLPEHLDNARQFRPGLKRFELLVGAAESNLDSTEGDYWPVISAAGSYTSYETDLPSLVDQWQLTLGLRWELFSGFETEGKVAEAKARLREVKGGLQRFSLSVDREVTDSYLRAEENGEGVSIADEALELAAENLELAVRRYQTGLGDLLEFNDAQLLYTGNQTELIVSYYGYLSSLARIEWATGRIPELENVTFE